MNIKEKDLIKLGFERVDQTPESSGSDGPWHYYCKDVGEICFLSCENDTDEAKKDKWSINILQSNVTFYKILELKTVIALLEKNII